MSPKIPRRGADYRSVAFFPRGRATADMPLPELPLPGGSSASPGAGVGTEGAPQAQCAKLRRLFDKKKLETRSCVKQSRSSATKTALALIVARAAHLARNPMVLNRVVRFRPCHHNWSYPM